MDFWCHASLHRVRCGRPASDIRRMPRVTFVSCFPDGIYPAERPLPKLPLPLRPETRTTPHEFN